MSTTDLNSNCIYKDPELYSYKLDKPEAKSLITEDKILTIARSNSFDFSNSDIHLKDFIPVFPNPRELKKLKITTTILTSYFTRFLPYDFRKHSYHFLEQEKDYLSQAKNLQSLSLIIPKLEWIILGRQNHSENLIRLISMFVKNISDLNKSNKNVEIIFNNENKALPIKVTVVSQRNQTHATLSIEITKMSKIYEDSIEFFTNLISVIVSCESDYDKVDIVFKNENGDFPVLGKMRFYRATDSSEESLKAAKSTAVDSLSQDNVSREVSSSPWLVKENKLTRDVVCQSGTSKQGALIQWYKKTM